MISEKDAQKCMGFLEVVRTCIDNAEVHIASAIDAEYPGKILHKASVEVEIAAKNLVFVCNEIMRISMEHLEGLYNANPVDGSPAGSTLPTGRKTRSN